MAQSSPDGAFEEVWELARRLSPLDKVRLIERLALALELALSLGPRSGSRSLLGLWADLGPAPADAEIQTARTEAWAHFPRADV